MRVYNSLGIEKSITLGFLSLILAGTLLLWIFNLKSPVPISPIDALFLSTSAVCVTGLSTTDIGTALSFPSQLVILFLVQLGGIGIMAAATSLLLVTGTRIGLRERLFLAGGLGVDSPQGVIRLLRLVLVYTLIFEALGALLLFFGFTGQGVTPYRALYLAIFHSICSFCNAGFSVFSDSLASFRTNLVIPGAVMLLAVAGGIGFPVMMELHHYRLGGRKFLSPYTKIVLASTASLIVFGTLFITLSEWSHSFAHLPRPARLWNGLFGCITSRTAGFETISYAAYSAEGMVVVMLLMLIGASPSSTGGGIKTTTFVVLLWSAWAEIKGEEEVVIWNRRISPHTTRRALALAFVYIFTLFICSALLSFFEDQPLFALVFEAISALGTGGISLGITPNLSAAGKIVIILLMFWGRVGLLTFTYSIARPEKHANVHLPATRIPIG